MTRISQAFEEMAESVEILDQRLMKIAGMMEEIADLIGIPDEIHEFVCENCAKELREKDDLDNECGCHVCGFEPCLCKSV